MNCLQSWYNSVCIDECQVHGRLVVNECVEHVTLFFHVDMFAPTLEEKSDIAAIQLRSITRTSPSRKVTLTKTLE